MSSVSSVVRFDDFKSKLLLDVEKSFSGQPGCKKLRDQAIEIARESLSTYSHGDSLSRKQIKEISNIVHGKIKDLLTSAAAKQESTLRYRSNRKASSSSNPDISTEIQDEKRAAKRPPFNPEDSEKVKEMYEKFFFVRSFGESEKIRELNAIIHEHTIKKINDGIGYDLDKYDKMIDKAYYDPNPPCLPAKASRPYVTLYEFSSSSTFDTAEKMINNGANPLVLDMANKRFVGGNPQSSAQEEDLVRRSTLKFGLMKISKGRDQYHPQISKGGIYVPSVEVFRKGMIGGYAICKPFICDVYALPAYDCNPQHADGFDKPSQDVDYKNGMMEKMRTMFREAYRNGNDSLLLGAWGCGAFQNDPKIVSQLFINVLAEPEFKGIFKKVLFSIPDRETLRTFAEAFTTEENEALLYHRKKPCCKSCLLQ